MCPPARPQGVASTFERGLVGGQGIYVVTSQPRGGALHLNKVTGPSPWLPAHCPSVDIRWHGDPGGGVMA